MIVHSRWNSFWRAAASPAMGWALAGVLMLGGVAVPVSVVHEHQVALEQAKKLAIQQEQERQKEEAAKQQAVVAMNDDELLSHVDSDIAQSTPDALEPLASLMNDANGN
jgi:anti-sigma factor RsiW